jgi:HEXXH motif-containing protein
MGPLPPAAIAWSAWAAAEEADPEQCAALLLHPQVGSWAAYTLRRKRGRAVSSVELWVDAGAVHTLALIANARSGRSWRTVVPVRDGAVMLPTLGLAVLADGGGAAVAEALCAAGEIRLRLGDRMVTVGPYHDRESPGWLPARRLSAGGDPPFEVILDDLDPYRELADPLAPDRLDAAAAERWARLLAGAWTLLTRDHPAQARAMAQGVACLVPMTDDDFGITRSASSGEAFGSVLISPPADEVDLAVSLIHEFQHIKLGGLLHLLTLTRYDGEPVLHAPWRDDPRPISGLLQGLYAFFGIADFWRVHRHRIAGVNRRLADFEFAYSWAQVQEVFATLSDSYGLTEIGRRLVAGLIDRSHTWEAEQVETVAASTAALVCAAHRAEWRLRYVRPDRNQIKLLAAAWRSETAMQLSAPRSAVIAEAVSERWFLTWPMAARDYLVGHYGGRFAGTAEMALLRGDRDEAYRGLRQALTASPGDPQVWSGLSLAGEELLRARPEWVYAVCKQLRDEGEQTDPLEVSHWLGDSVPSLLLPVVEQDSFDLDKIR